MTERRHYVRQPEIVLEKSAGFTKSITAVRADRALGASGRFTELSVDEVR